jgi:hypothetical protein
MACDIGDAPSYCGWHDARVAEQSRPLADPDGNEFCVLSAQ